MLWIISVKKIDWTLGSFLISFTHLFYASDVTKPDAYSQGALSKQQEGDSREFYTK